MTTIVKIFIIILIALNVICLSSCSFYRVTSEIIQNESSKSSTTIIKHQDWPEAEVEENFLQPGDSIDNKYRFKKNYIKQIGIDGTGVSVVSKDGELYYWGGNYYFTGGTESKGPIYSPQKVNIPEIVKKAVMGVECSCVLTENGSVYTWGYNPFGELGHGDYENRKAPTRVNINKRIIDIGANKNAIYLLTEQGEIYRSGYPIEKIRIDYNFFEEQQTLGFETPTFKLAKFPSKVQQMSVDTFLLTALTEDYRVYYMGLMGNDYISVETPSLIEFPEEIVKVDCGGTFVMALSKSGKLYGYGQEEVPMLFDKTTDQEYKTDYYIKSIKTIKDFEINNSGVIAISNEDEVYTWGYDGYNLITDNIEKERNNCFPIPQKKQIIGTPYKIAVSSGNAAVITKEGEAYIWGTNGFGRLLNGNLFPTVIPERITE